MEVSLRGLAHSQYVESLISSTKNLILSGKEGPDISSFKETLLKAFVEFIGLAFEANNNYNEEQAEKNCEDADLIMMCYRIVEAYEVWSSDTPSKIILNKKIKKEDSDILYMFFVEKGET